MTGMVRLLLTASAIPDEAIRLENLIKLKQKNVIQTYNNFESNHSMQWNYLTKLKFSFKYNLVD